MPFAPPASDSQRFPEDCREWPLLRNVLAQPSPGLALVELPALTFAHRLITAAEVLVGPRPLHTVRFDALRDSAADLLRLASASLASDGDRVAVLFLVDESSPPFSPDEPTKEKLATFWHGINQQRERRAELSSHTLWLLTSIGYAAVNEHALHFKRWIPLKLHLLLPPPVASPHEPPRQLEPSRTETSSPNALDDAERFLWLEKQLTRAEQAGETGPSLTAR